LGLKLAPSNITGSGLGLFTTAPFKKGQHIVEYRGEIRTLAELENDPSDYALEINKKEAIDARKTGTSSLGGRANDCRSVNKKKGECKSNNSKFVVDKRRKKARLKATKAIKKGDEVFVGYGRSYWSKPAGP
jgi:SET domain-containing protein